jgi:hypothetical protein
VLKRQKRQTNLIFEQVLTFKLLNKLLMNETEERSFMPPKANKTTRQSEGLRKHGAESGFDTKDKRDQSTIPGTSKTLSASNKTPCDPKFWQRKTFQQTPPTKAKTCDSEDSEVNEFLTSHIDTYNIASASAVRTMNHPRNISVLTTIHLLYS